MEEWFLNYKPEQKYNSDLNTNISKKRKKTKKKNKKSANNLFNIYGKKSRKNKKGLY